MNSALNEEVASVAKEAARTLAGNFSEKLRPRLAQIFIDTALVQARKMAGKDVVTAEIALESSIANIARHERVLLEREASNVLIAALMRVAGLITG